MRLSLRKLQRRNALGDAPRHRFAPRRAFKIGRRASRTACDAERRTIVEKTLFYRDITDDAGCDVSDG
ncbi:hypothetical protein CVE30_24145 [Pseudomonas syringae pv. actinidiae]|nr:hypothetical protein [Pseudomonas syringae pv. actinidiae]